MFKISFHEYDSSRWFKSVFTCADANDVAITEEQKLNIK